MVVTNYGKPRLLVLSVDEFTRLKTAAGEAVPSEVIDRKPVVQCGLPPDPLGRDTMISAGLFSKSRITPFRGGIGKPLVKKSDLQNVAWAITVGVIVFDRKARILIADNTPLSVFSLLGANALNWLFVPGAEVWVTDMVKEESIRELDTAVTHVMSSGRSFRLGSSGI